MARALGFLLFTLTVVVSCREAPRDAAIATVEADKKQESGSERPKRLVFGLAPFLAGEDMRREYQALVDYVGKAVGLPIELRMAESYQALPGMLQRFEVHVAILPPLTYVQAKKEHPELLLLATQIVDGSSTYAAYILTRDDNGVNAVEDLKGKRFAFVDKHSSSGYVYPLAYLREQGIVPETFFSKVSYAGDHTRLIDMILKKDIDAGATFATAYKLASVEHPQGKRLRILAKTGRIPLDAFCASERLDKELVDKMQAALLGLSTRSDEGRAVLRGLTSINGFVAVQDAHYDEVRKVAALVEGSR